MFSDLLRDDVFRLETARLWLRWPRMADAPSIVRYAGEEQIAQMTASIPYPYSREQAERFIFASRAGNAAGAQIALALTRKGRPAEAIGMIGVHETRTGHAFIGYWIGAPFQAQGLMSEAVEAIVNLAFHAGDLETIDAEVRVENPASARVLEKAGFGRGETGPVNLPVRGGVFQRTRYNIDRTGWLARTRALVEETRPQPIHGAAP